MTFSNEDFRMIARTIRTLSMDAVQKANSGHPGMPMGCADIAAVLWSRYLVHNPADTEWVNRDRFVLSAGHGSMLLYSMLHFSGYDLSMDDIKNFRQLGSRTPGHPEHYHTAGVETTTGPLGQGFANGVGMALGARLLREEFPEIADLIDHKIYAIISDGDLMEGVASEAASLAGHWKLGDLVYIYDSNGISIEGSTELAYGEDVARRFESYGWHVLDIDGHNYEEIASAIEQARDEKERPSLIIARTSIARGSATKENSADSHGAPLGEEEVRQSKIKLGADPEQFFAVPEGLYDIFRKRETVLKREYSQWQEKFKELVKGDLREKWESFFALPEHDRLRELLPVFEEGSSIATRSASGKVLESLFEHVPCLVGGSADLGPSNKSFVKGFSETGRGKVGRNIHFGVREHAMGAIQNGLAYYGGFIPYGATFFVFMDYMRPAVRLAALGGLKTVFVFSHDSFFVGEDGPTHQPIEHLAAARAIPNLDVIRPADAVETAEAWAYALARTEGPTALCLTRQNVPVLHRGENSNGDLSRGAYVIRGTQESPDLVIYASGSEVSLSIETADLLAKNGIIARVVSFPSWEIFERQELDYKSSILAPDLPSVVIEAGLSMGWERYAGTDALFITVEDFGASAPAGVLADKFGFTAESVAERIKNYLS